MMRNNLFKKSFNKEYYKDEIFVDKLLEQINISEKNLKENLANIRNDFPNLTDHSLNHSLMLWNYAELIIGDELYLNPLEAYVLHMCFLIHDAGMCFSILNNKDEIEKTEAYKDFIALNPNLHNVEYESLFYCVRKLHGDFAIKIADATLSSGKRVIEDEDLRDEFSSLIGKISKSHSCDIAYIENELNTYIKPSHINWPIDSQKLAFILRVSDASHLDNLRTPLSKRKIETEIEGISKEHWIFQKKLGFPVLENGYLKFTSSSSFSIDEKRAWWLCYDALKVLDNELKKAEVYFLENNKRGFLAKGVKSIDNTLDLGENYIKTEGWKSIDTKVKATNPKLLAANVGGKNLYNFSYFAIRELIQNSFDAINLRRIKEKDFEGKVKITLNFINNQYILTVIDNGIGMSKNILCNHLLDFGTSYWNSYDFYDEYIGIAREKFKSIGKFGIGFFSVFMLGDYVEVDSLKYGEPYHRRHKLVFEQGLFENPLFKEYEPSSIESNYGTTVNVILNENPYTEGFLKELGRDSLYKLVQHLVPSPICNIEVEELGSLYHLKKDIIIDSSKYSFKDILNLTYTEADKSRNQLIELAKFPDLYLEPIFVDNIIVGQLGIIPKVSQIGLQGTGLVISNGIRVSSFSEDLVGYLKIEDITDLIRSQYNSKIPFDSVYSWGLKYLEYMRANADKYDYESKIIGLEFSLGIYDKSNFIGIYLKDKNNMVPFNESLLIEYLNNSSAFTYYQLMYGVDDNFIYNGFVSIISPVSLSGVVSVEDHKRILSFESYLKNIISMVWGKFKTINTNGHEDFPLEYEKFILSKLPYMQKTIYIKE